MGRAAGRGARRGEERLAAVQGRVIGGVVTLAALLLGRMASLEAMTATGWTLAIGIVVAGLLLERAARRRPRLWWARPHVYPMILLVLTPGGHTLHGIAGAMVFAAADAVGGA